MFTTDIDYPTRYSRSLEDGGRLVTNQKTDFICFNPSYEGGVQAPNYPFGDDSACGYFFHHKGDAYVFKTPLYRDFDYIKVDAIQPYFKTEMDNRNCSFSVYKLDKNPEPIYYFDSENDLGYKSVGDGTFNLLTDSKNVSTSYILECIVPSFDAAMVKFEHQYEKYKKEQDSSPLRIIVPALMGSFYLSILIAPLLYVFCYNNKSLEKPSSNDVENKKASKTIAPNTDDAKKSGSCFGFLRGKLSFFNKREDSNSYELQSLISENQNPKYGAIV